MAAAVREMVRSMGAEQLDEAIAFATMELAGRDIPFEDVFRLCDEQELRRAKKSSMAEEVERIKGKLVGGKTAAGRAPTRTEETMVDLLRALRSTSNDVRDAGGEQESARPSAGLRSKHSSEKVPGLAAALYKYWKAIVDEHLTRSSSKPPAPSPTKTASASDHAKKTDMAAAHKPAPAPSPRKTASNKHEAAPARADDAKLAAARRKLQDGYKEAASAKKQRVIQVIDTPKKVNRRPVAVVERRRIMPGVATVAPLRMCRAV
ncbi:hypothetical protein OsI_32915 [Oryza sativa Indica Group]|uniref:TFIIS N-terminal domain-containing protein n=1 Tax=Oryza sativa subsp. indica TaxID=39946 RepID=A2Z5I7_ORYSI|nr:hypothetical protein OsI_32915 [Oryza sativa Indica Group]